MIDHLADIAAHRFDPADGFCNSAWQSYAGRGGLATAGIAAPSMMHILSRLGAEVTKVEARPWPGRDIAGLCIRLLPGNIQL